jgi:hypothetical protein
MTFELGATISLTAVPDAGSVFNGWAGCEPAPSPLCTFTALPDLFIYAIFDRIGDPVTPLPVVQPGGPPTPAAPQFLPPGCTIGGTDGNDTIEGTARADVICTLGGRDHVHGGGGADVIRAGGGADVIEGGAGHDRIDPGPGRDLVYAGPGKDSVSSRDRMRDVIRGGPGRDSARGDAMDVLIGIERRGG